MEAHCSQTCVCTISPDGPLCAYQLDFQNKVFKQPSLNDSRAVARRAAVLLAWWICFLGKWILCTQPALTFHQIYLTMLRIISHHWDEPDLGPFSVSIVGGNGLRLDLCMDILAMHAPSLQHSSKLNLHEKLCSTAS